jgi:hypothetical protein
VCATCSEHFTRRYSATRHNRTIHNGIGEIVTLLEYLVGRNSGRYQPSHPSLYRRRRGEKPIHNFGYTTTVAADSMGDAFRPSVLKGKYRHYQQQTPSHSISLPSLPPPTDDVLPYPTDQVSQSQPMTTTNNQGILSQETILKIQELKRLFSSYLQYCLNPDAVIKSNIYFCNVGNNTFLDETLEQLRMINGLR